MITGRLMAWNDGSISPDTGNSAWKDFTINTMSINHCDFIINQKLIQD